MSLKARLLIALVAVAFAALLVADLVTYSELKTFLYSQVDSSLQTSHVAIEAALEGNTPPSSQEADNDGDDDGPSAPSSTVSDGGKGAAFCASTANELAPGTFVSVQNPRGQSVVDGDDCPAIEIGGARYSPSLPKVISGFSAVGPNREQTVYLTADSKESGGPTFRVRVSKLQAGPLVGDELVLAEPLGSTHSTIVRLIEVELIVAGAALLAAVLVGWWLVRLGLAPLRRVEQTAETIAGGDLAHRVPGAGVRTEVGRVALALNFMLENIEEAFAERDETESQLRESEDRLRRFVGDASHELRTPVAAISAYAELFERVNDRSGEDASRILRGIRHETDRMGHLVEDLLLLARLDEGQPLAHEPVELVDLLSGALYTARAVGPDWPVQLVAEDAVEVLGDAIRLRQVVDNLLGNVRAHTPPGTSTTVHVFRSGGDAIVEIADEGPGITEEQASRVFERFYRVEASRSRTHGGAGLGLSIVGSIVNAHGGTVTARPGNSRGAVFTVTLPVADRTTSADPVLSSDQH